MSTDILWPRMAIAHVYRHFVANNGNFILLLTCSGQDWQFHILVTSHGQEWQFHMSTDI